MQNDFDILGMTNPELGKNYGLKDMIEVNGGIENFSQEMQTYVGGLKEAEYETITLG